MTLVITSKVIKALQDEIDKLEVDRKRAWILAQDWSDEPRVSALSAEEVHAEYESVDTDQDLRGEDYETLDELNGTIGGLQRAIAIVREVEQS